MASPPSSTPDRRRQVKTAKLEPEMPAWERKARWAYTLAILAWLAATTAVSFNYIYHYPIPFVPLVFLMPILMCLYLRSGRRGWLGATSILLISSIIFFGVLPAELALFIGMPGVGFVDRCLDWAVGIDQGGGLVLLLTVRAAMIFSAAIFLVIARLAQYKSISHLSGSKSFKAAAIGAVLLPLLLAMVTSSGETNANPAVVPPASIGWGNAQDMLVPDVFQASRVFDQAAGTWTYSIFFSNPTQTELTVTQVWAGRDAIAPFSERITIGNGSGVRIVGEGIVFGTGNSSGTIRFSTAQGHNIVTVIGSNGAKYTASWTEQI